MFAAGLIAFAWGISFEPCMLEAGCPPQSDGTIHIAGLVVMILGVVMSSLGFAIFLGKRSARLADPRPRLGT